MAVGFVVHCMSVVHLFLVQRPLATSQVWPFAHWLLSVHQLGRGFAVGQISGSGLMLWLEPLVENAVGNPTVEPV